MSLIPGGIALAKSHVRNVFLPDSNRCQCSVYIGFTKTHNIRGSVIS